MKFFSLFFLSKIAAEIKYLSLTSLKLSAHDAEEVCNRAGGTLPYFPGGEKEHEIFTRNIESVFDEIWYGIDWLPREHYGDWSPGCMFYQQISGMIFRESCEEKKNFMCRFEANKVTLKYFGHFFIFKNWQKSKFWQIFKFWPKS